MVFKILLLFFDKLSIINLLASLGLPTENTGFLQNYLDILNELSNVKVLLFIAFLGISFFVLYIKLSLVTIKTCLVNKISLDYGYKLFMQI